MSKAQKIAVVKKALTAQFVGLYGEEMRVDVLKVVLKYGSLGAVTNAINKGHLDLPVYGNPPKGKTVKSADVATYIAEQYANALTNKLTKKEVENEIVVLEFN